MSKANSNIQAQMRLRAITFNNTATSKMKLEKHEQSIQLLSSALKSLKQDIDRASPDIDANVGSCKICEDLDRHFSDILRSSGGCNQMRDGSYLFTRALSIPRKAAQSPESNALLSKIVMFNLALSHQMVAAQRSGVVADNFLRKACRLYQLAYRVQTPTQPQSERQLLPALVNNMSVVYSRIHETERATRAFGGLITLVMNANAIGDPTYRTNANIECFLSNACNAVHTDCQPASAA